MSCGFGLWQLAFASKATLDDAAFEDAYQRMMSIKSDQGRPLGVKPAQLFVGPSNRAAANRVINVASKAVSS